MASGGGQERRKKRGKQISQKWEKGETGDRGEWAKHCRRKEGVFGVVRRGVRVKKTGAYKSSKGHDNAMPKGPYRKNGARGRKGN